MNVTIFINLLKKKAKLSYKIKFKKKNITFGNNEEIVIQRIIPASLFGTVT